MIKYDSKTLIESTSNGKNEICALDSTRFIVVFTISNALYARIGTNTNGVLTFGSRYLLSTTSAEPFPLGVILLSTDKVVVGFMESSIGIRHICCSISGDVITVGTKNTYSPDTFYFGDYQHHIVKLRDNYFATVAQGAFQNGIMVFSVTGTTINAINFFGLGISVVYFAVEYIETDKFVFAYIDSADTNKGKSMVATFNGSAFSWGSANTFATTNGWQGMQLTMYDTNKLYVNSYLGGAFGFNGVLSGTSITWDTTRVGTGLSYFAFLASGNKNIVLICANKPDATHCNGDSKVCAPLVDIDPSGNANYYTRICHLPGTKYFIATYNSLYAQALTISSSGSNILTNFLN